ncbi:MAG: ABC transporter substrate-binding protein, partial [Chloroflexota bacterium]|nr:ABC transporter substrate-binding protein [Chloroflexota bacterium]
MRKLSIVAFLSLFVLAVAPLAAQEPITIDFYFPTASATVSNPALGASIEDVFNRYAETFEAANLGIDINVVYTGSYTDTRTAIQTELAGGGAGPDVAVMLATDLFSFIEDGTILAAQDFIDATDDGTAYVEDFYPAFLLNSYDENGVLWSVPYQRSTPVLYYNKEQFAQVGLDPEQPPRNREELVEYAQALTLPDGERWGVWLPTEGFPIWLFSAFIIADGQHFVNESPSEVFLNTPQTESALDFINSLGGEYGVEPTGALSWGDGPTIFTSGQASMLFHTTGSLTRILNEAPFDVGVAFLPSGTAGEDGTGYGAPTGGGNLYLFANSTPEEQAAAWAWVEFLSSPEIQADWGAATGYVAARQSAWELEPLASLVAERPQYSVARDQLAFAQKEFSSYRTIDVQGIINSTLGGILSGAETDAAAALTTA